MDKIPSAREIALRAATSDPNIPAELKPHVAALLERTIRVRDRLIRDRLQEFLSTFRSAIESTLSPKD